MFHRYKGSFYFYLYINLVEESSTHSKNVKPFSSNKLLSANNFFFLHIKNYDCSIQR